MKLLPRVSAPLRRRCSPLLLCAAVPLLLAGCAGEKIVFNYPGEEIDLQFRYLKTPALYIDSVTDLRPPLQREGGGHFFGIDYPKDAAWDRPATEVYAEALAQDVEQTQLVELVPLRGQADYVLSVDLLSLGCRFERSKTSFLLPAALGAGAGMAAGGDGAHRAKLAVALGLAAIVAVPVPAHNRAEAEVRMVLKDRSGNILWETSCLGEFEKKVYIRGRSLPKLFIIIDEAQNLTPHEVKTVVSRAGEGAKVILTGDAYQIDNPYLDAESNGLTYVVERFKNQPIHGHVTLAKSERSVLASLAAELL